jgi:hypothetical protein
MTKLLTGVSAIAIAAMFAAPAQATGWHPHDPDVFAAALAGNHGYVAGNYSLSLGSTDRALIDDDTADDARGVIQMNQNAGANSQLQNATAIAYVEAKINADDALALAGNAGRVEYNYSGRGAYYYLNQNSAEIDDSFDRITGVVNVNQNAGDNSLLQNATSIAALIDCTKCEDRGHYRPHGSTWGVAGAGNDGNVGGKYGNWAESYGSNSSALMDESFDGTTGVAQVNQNVGANSLLQNATAIAYIDGRLGARGRAVAVAFNDGVVTGSGNTSIRTYSSDSATMTNSFTGFTGVANVNQNAGDNSLLQNATAIAALIDCLCEDDGEKPQHGYGHGGSGARSLLALSLAGNEGSVTYNYAWSYGSHSGVSMSDSFDGARGIMQVNQNAGANSLLQNATAVAFVRARLDRHHSRGAALAGAWNDGVVTGSGNTSIRIHSTNAASMRSSFDRASGAVNVNQNAGDNSLLQNATSLAAIRYCGPRCAGADLLTVAVAGNTGYVAGNQASSTASGSSATIANSFRGFTGVANVNQNVGANSMLQNSTSIGAIYPSSR